MTLSEDPAGRLPAPNPTEYVEMEEGNVLFLYDSFARKRIMKSFCDYMKKQGFKILKKSFQTLRYNQ